MDAGGGARGLVEHLQGAGEIVVRIRADQGGDGHVGHRLGDEDGRCLGALHFGRVFGVCEEREVSGRGMFHARDPVNFQFRIAMQNGSQSLR